MYYYELVYELFGLTVPILETNYTTLRFDSQYYENSITINSYSILNSLSIPIWYCLGSRDPSSILVSVSVSVTMKKKIKTNNNNNFCSNSACSFWAKEWEKYSKFNLKILGPALQWAKSISIHNWGSGELIRMEKRLLNGLASKLWANTSILQSNNVFYCNTEKQ